MPTYMENIKEDNQNYTKNKIDFLFLVWF